MLGSPTDHIIQHPGGRERRFGAESQAASGNGLDHSRALIDGTASEAEIQCLARTIESLIIPRLMLAHGGPARADTAPNDRDATISAADLIDFTATVIHAEADAVARSVEQFLMRGISAEHLCLELLAPTARRLGDLWNDDLCDFVGVTLGLGRLQQVLHDLAPGLAPSVECRTSCSKILLVPAFDDQHSLGLNMVREFFRSAGWEVRGGAGSRPAEVERLLRAEWFDVAGLSVGTHCAVDALAEQIRRLRAVSRNPHIGILVGGAMFTAEPALAQRVGADATATDAREAIAVAEGFAALRR